MVGVRIRIWKADGVGGGGWDDGAGAHMGMPPTPYGGRSVGQSVNQLQLQCRQERRSPARMTFQRTVSMSTYTYLLVSCGSAFRTTYRGPRAVSMAPMDRTYADTDMNTANAMAERRAASSR